MPSTGGSVEQGFDAGGTSGLSPASSRQSQPTPEPAGPDERPGPRTDLVVVGGGAAGLSAATAGRAAGVTVTLVSDGPLGGDCTWHGCVPTKSLLEAAAAGLPLLPAVEHAQAVVRRVARSESEVALRRAGATVVRSRARLLAGAQVALTDGSLLTPDLGVVLATGSRPLGQEALGLTVPQGCLVATTDTWLEAVQAFAVATANGTSSPVVVVGGGASGVELAQALARCLRVSAPDAEAAPVVLLERAGSLLPDLPGAGAVVAASLRADGVRVVTAARPQDLARVAPPGSLVLLTAGRRPVLDLLDPGCGVAVGGHGVVVDAAMRTTAARVCAAGDVTGLRPTTHVAAAAGRVAVASLLGLPAALDPTWAPQVVNTDPEVAAVGTLGGTGTGTGTDGEEDAAPHRTTRSVRLPLSHNDRTAAAALPGAGRLWTRGGFAQVWVTGALLVGPGAGELVSEVALAGRLGLTVEQWSGGQVGLGGMSAHHAYPTWSWLWEAVTDRLLGR